MMRSVLEIARHELTVSVRTARALIVAGLYVASALLGGTGVILSVRFIEKQAMQQLIDRGASPVEAALALSLLNESGYQRLFAWFAGVAVEELAPSFATSVVVPFLFWGSLAFLPLLVLLTSYDQVAGDVQSRAICYRTLRASRAEILLGKLASQAVLFVAITALATLALVLLAAALLTTFSVPEVVPGLVRMGLLLLPFGMCYLGVALFASASVRQPFSALVASFGVLFGLWVLGRMKYVPPEHTLGFLRWLEWLSPATYQSGLWVAGIWQPLLSAAAYLVFGALFVAGAIWRLRRREL